MGLALQRQASWHHSRGKGYSLLPGWEGQLLASFPSLCCWDLPLLHFLHLEINEFRSATRPPSIHCRLAVNTETEMGWNCVGGLQDQLLLGADLGSRCFRMREA